MGGGDVRRRAWDPPAAREGSRIDGEGDPASVLERLRTKLLDLTLTNRLLNFKQTGARVVRVIDELPDQLFERLCAGAELEILPLTEPSRDHPLWARSAGFEKAARSAMASAYAAELGFAASFDLPLPDGAAPAEKHADDAVQTLLFPTELEKALRAIASDARSALEEKGSNILYLIFGLLEWYESESSDKVITSPLVMLPVSLRRGEPDRKTGTYRFYVSYSDEDVLPNISLQEKLRRDFGLTLPDLEDEDSPEKYLARIASTVPLPSRWKIRRQVSLGLLAFSKLFMYRDLDPKAWPVGAGPAAHPRVAELLGANDTSETQQGGGYDGEYDFEGGGTGPAPSAVPPVVLDADSSQHSALVDAFAGKSLVIEGPPGTGKSQTIANLIAAAMDAGKTVLFVADKLTALEVVRRRLDEVGLGPFCLELHSDKTQKSRVMDDLKRRLDLRRTFRPPAALEEHARVLADSRHRLNSYARRINGPVGAIGWTVHQVLWGTQRRRSTLGTHAETWKNVPFPGVETLSLSAYEELRRCALAFGDALTQVRSAGELSSHPFWGIWSGRTDPAFEAELLDTLKYLRERSLDVAGHMEAVSRELGAPCPPSADYMRGLSTRAEHLHQCAHQAVMKGAQALSTASARSELGAWLDQVGAYVEARSRLDDAIPDAEARRSAFELPPVAFDHVAPSTSLARIADAPDTVQDGKAELREAATRIERFEAAIGSSLPGTFAVAQMVRDVIDCASRAPSDALSYRTRMDSDVDALLETAERRYEELKREDAELDAQFHLGSIPAVSALEEYSAVCASAGFFSFFSGAYRAAKRQFLILGRQGKRASDAEMAAAFRALAAHARKREAFNSDSALLELLGASFRGVDTRFDKIQAARRWQKEAGAVQRQHRRAIGSLSIVNAPVDLLQDLAALSPGSRTPPGEALGRTRAGLGIRADVTNVEAAALPELEARLDETLRFIEPLRAIALRLRGKGPPTAGDLRAITNKHRELLATRDRLEAAEGCRTALGEAFAGVATAPTVARATLAYANALFDPQTPDILRSYLLRRPSRDFRDRLAALLGGAHRALVDMYAAVEAFRITGEVALAHWYGSDDPRPSPELVSTRTSRALAEQNALPGWAAYLRARIALFNAGGDFLRDAAERDAGIDLTTLTTAAELVVYAAHAARTFARDPELAGHDGVAHTSVRDQFQRYDEGVMRLERERMAASIDARPVPEGVRASLVKNLTEFALIEHELRKQRRHVPIRQLVNRAGGALRALKPCFMMSPRSVAQYLEGGKHSFDLIIMDEASQLRPEDAIGAVVRGKQLVVVGDSKQLPPTSFFTSDGGADRDAEEDENETITDNKESILDLARTVFRSVRRLRWHYRSRHGSLIAFSNNRYYGGDLIVFPSANDAPEDLGVRLVHVEKAVYADGENLLEAQAVVDAVIDHLREQPEATLGVVALNIRQKTLIQELLYDRFKTEPELRQHFERPGLTDEGFVKNLESVQGDERDVIFISVTYGPSTPGGPLARRFGPINSDNGWRRLNVLFTRAKRRVVVFASFASEQLADEGLSKGARDLRDYIAFARTGTYQQGRLTGREPDSDFEVAVATVVREAGYSVTPQFGVAGYFIDLAVRHRDRSGPYLLGIECDGAPYHSSFSARDRDRLRQQVLEGLGWKIHRIWSTDWYRDPHAQTQRLIEAIRGAEVARVPTPPE
jgi:very-short-patch-repair endonuclease